MRRRYRISLVGSKEPNGSRMITTDAGSFPRKVVFSVESKYLKEYVPNAGDWLIRDASTGAIRFEAHASQS